MVINPPEKIAGTSASFLPRKVARSLLNGTSALGLSVAIERGLGFLANLLAARIGGTSTFGAYSLALTTANNISTYAGGGIGSTAVRFSGKYSRDSEGYLALCRTLLIISFVSAALAAVGLVAGAPAIAQLLGKQSLTGLLRWAGLSAAGMILLECCRGFLVGQRRLSAMLLLSSLVGIGMIAFLPAASRRGPLQMITVQGCITVGSVLLCFLFYKSLGLAPTTTVTPQHGIRPMLLSVWSFGVVQLAGLVGMNAAGWWLTSLIARADTSMVQVGFLAISNQLRNIVSLAPGLLSESGLAVMASSEDDELNMADRVMAVCTFAALFISLFVAAFGIVILPWGLSLLYGRSYSAATTAACVALATGVIHMGSAPASARLTMLSIRVSGIINTIWAVFVGGSATVLLFLNHVAIETLAWRGALIYLVGHIISALLVLGALARRHALPGGVASLFGFVTTSVLALTVLAFMRTNQPARISSISLLMLAVGLLSLATTFYIARRRHWLPSAAMLRQTLRSRGLLPAWISDRPWTRND